MMARYASYQALATIIRHRFSNPKSALRELFCRLVFEAMPTITLATIRTS
ncbi:hypothetical protein RGCCGE502_28393 (plasmid) [Rhizobium grahamii CCGE 502]|uniref:Uncharacterized protein n=1 Tax=Rhizobium grahamii CCGE 502 TaxID=990285 RepID=S3HM87_9HYPH|nr:hypothetical protein RGCCGE502_28393 [Rhizobium grahamii CCGE 502]